MVPSHHNEPNQMHFCVERIANDDKSNEDVFPFHMTHIKRVQVNTMEEPDNVYRCLGALGDDAIHEKCFV